MTFHPGQIIEHRSDHSRYRIERVTACFAVLTSLPDGKPGGFGRVRLTTLAQMVRVIV